MIYVRPLTTDEQTDLTRMMRQEIGRISQRAQMILLSAQRRSVPEIATIFGVSRATVRFWLRRFEAEGPAGWYADPRSGRPRKVTPEVETSVARLLLHDPHHLDATYLAPFWSTAMLVLALNTQLTVDGCRSTVRTALYRRGVRWRRPRLSMPSQPDPDKARQQREIAQAVILYGDESRVQTLPLLRAMWQWIGQQSRIPPPGSNTARAIFGALNIRTGAWH